VTAYALGPRPEPASGVRARIAAAVEHWREIESIDAERIAAQVRADGIDVLVDLNGFTRRVADVFVLRPAPLQVNFLGYTGTLGLDCYDFIVADRYCLRDDERAHYAEAPLYVDPCYLPWEPVRDVAATPPRAAYGLPERAPVLYVPAQAYKIMPETFACWIDLMRERADAVLWLRANEPATDARLAAEAARRGIPPERVVFAPHEPTPRYLARLPLADLVLDTYPFGAHTGVNDALYAGVPVLTRAGASFASRASASQLRAAGLAGLVAGSEDEYRALGRRLVGDDAQLQALRRQLAAARTTAPLFDADRYARAFGAAILAAWDARARAGTGA
jgi:predicted O-linked N-acetylglucosamine transferase (SPINDLY family)